MNRQMHNIWHSKGNLIISGEYFVLTGATALAVPLKFGQSMLIEIKETNHNTVRWTTNELGKPWFTAEYNTSDFEIINTTDEAKASFLQNVLRLARSKQPDFISKSRSYIITCETDFKLNWGWGSSSTLITNTATWAGIDPFELNRLVSSGSGYDIAASMAPAPILFRIKNDIPETRPVHFNPPFKKSIWFLYSGRKQNTAASIERNSEAVKSHRKQIPIITKLSEDIAKEEDMSEFMRHIAEHEKIIASTINAPRLKVEFFNDFPGEIKSLGAWGGDCAMVVSAMDETDVRKYFANKGLDTLFGFDEIVKT